MKIEGQFRFEVISSEALWNFLTDANRVAECLPGCEQLTRTGEDSYEMKMRIGIGAIRGTFSGQIRLHDLKPTTDYQMTVSGNGAPGFVKGAGRIHLDPGPVILRRRECRRPNRERGAANDRRRRPNGYRSVF